MSHEQVKEILLRDADTETEYNKLDLLYTQQKEEIYIKLSGVNGGGGNV